MAIPIKTSMFSESVNKTLLKSKQSFEQTDFIYQKRWLKLFHNYITGSTSE